jgi:diguanylate cyclase (GGDEF)-like protein/PAS domain S-box-containing protein
MRLGACFLTVALASGFVTSLEGVGGPPHLLWIANGVLLAYLLLAPRWRWPAYLAVGLGADLAGSSFINGNWKQNLLFASLNIVEVAISAHLLRKRCTDLPQFTERAYLLRFTAFAILVGPAVAGAIFAPFALFLFHANAGSCFLSWVIGDGLGNAITTPACIEVFRTGLKGGFKAEKPWLYTALLAFVTVAGFGQTRIPLMVLIYPCLVLVLLRMGMAWAAMGALFVTTVGSYFTFHGNGPLILAATVTPVPPAVRLQFFVAAGMVTLYSISIVLDRQKATDRRLREIVLMHKLVTENSRDVIILAGFDGRRSYVSAAAENMAGWKPEELMKYKSLDLVHPEDRPKAEDISRRLKNGEEGSTIECRVLKRDGDYVWVEASLRVVRDPATATPTGILNMVRDISERKQAEQELQNAYHALETLAVTDPLTHLANRRRLDQCLTAEWRRGMREHQPLSLLLIDVDLFKSYNDTYGHLRGDTCLKQIAEAALDVVTRPGDLVARFGGEEFAVVLPNTPNEGAMQVARQICASLGRRRLPHSANPLGYLTISVGCATMLPGVGQHSVALIQRADDALYVAKRGGRNRVCNADAEIKPEGVPQAC